MPPKVVPTMSDDLRVEPPNWWTGMLHNRVQVLVRREGLAAWAVRLGEARGVTLEKVARGDSPNYLFLTLRIAEGAPQQKVPLVFTHPDQTTSFTHEFPIWQRNQAPKGQGLTSRDVVYLIMPDRFANGDPANDNVPGMLDGLARDSLLGRHGGDLKGIQDRLDYLKDLGITAIWLNPELENDQARTSYHGYAITDLYRIDRRLGTNELYRDLVGACHDRGIKVVRDAVPNHIGDNHYWVKDLPTRDWLNVWPEMTKTTYRAPTLLDPYASEYDKKHFNDGWFAPSMPDLNQRNPYLANYLIQQAIWWVEYSGLDAFRIDTYTYSDQDFMSRYCREIRAEYPSIHLFGEVWEYDVIVQGFFADNQPMARAKFDSNQPGVVDFQVSFAIQEALTREQGWTEGAARIYYTLAQDFFYEDPTRNVVMLDNHDTNRFFSAIGENLNKYKSGIAFLLTTRGIPQIYYATEILGTGFEAPSHGNIRKDFPGGWPGDPVDKFTAAGRTPQENEAFNFMRTLLRYRNATPTLQTGRLMQFVPENGVYVYFRYDNARTIMVLLNTANAERTVDTRRFAERMQGFSRATDVVTGRIVTDLTEIRLEQNAPLVLELKR
ncbi:MAG: glycoside hydrolase family 13 protein [Lewinellaceae bacterium]|nr:glycoside hydrolase family 13 protein [Lewinellaceae bacterium]